MDAPFPDSVNEVFVHTVAEGKTVILTGGLDCTSTVACAVPVHAADDAPTTM